MLLHEGQIVMVIFYRQTKDFKEPFESAFCVDQKKG